MKEILNEKEVCEILQIKPRTLQQWRMKGTGPRFARLTARLIRYRSSDLNAWIESRACLSDSKVSTAERAEAHLLYMKTQRELHVRTKVWAELSDTQRVGMSSLESWLIEAIPGEIVKQLLELRARYKEDTE